MASPLDPTPLGVRVRVPAKINLALGVGAVGQDGYHPLTTVFQAVSLYDELYAVDDEPGRLSLDLIGEGAGEVAVDDSNLAMRAALLLADRFGGRDRFGASLHLKKSIPVAGGMAGGSADAAAALLACSVLWDLDVDPDELRELGAELGADVPFALLGGTAIGRGRGDELVPVLNRGCHHWVLAFADFGLSTPAVYRRFDELRPDGGSLAMPEALMTALTGGGSAALAKALHNDLAEAAIDLEPSLQSLLDTGLEHGALAAMVSGSGPTCAFLCADEAAAVDVSNRLARLDAARAVRRVTGPVPGARLIG